MSFFLLFALQQTGMLLAQPAIIPQPTPQEDQEAWDEYEEDGPQDLEEQLEHALDRAFPGTQASSD